MAAIRKNKPFTLSTNTKHMPPQLSEQKSFKGKRKEVEGSMCGGKEALFFHFVWVDFLISICFDRFMTI